MARIRSIKPEMATDAALASVSFAARYLFILLITQADDYGLVRARVRQLLGALYPHEEGVTPEMLLRWVAELVGIGVMRWRQTADGQPVLELVNWSKHQKVDKPGQPKLRDSLLPFGEPSEESSPKVSETSAEMFCAEVGEGEGEGTGKGDGPPSADKPRRPRKQDEPYVDIALEKWRRGVGHEERPAIRRYVGPVVGYVGQDRALKGLDTFITLRARIVADGKTEARYVPGLPRFLSRYTDYVPDALAVAA